MSTFIPSTTSRAIGLLVAVTMLLGVVAIPTAHAVTLAELVELFIALGVIPADKAAQARTVLTQQAAPATSACPYTWTANLTVGSTGESVKKLQMLLNGYTPKASASATTTTKSTNANKRAERRGR